MIVVTVTWSIRHVSSTWSIVECSGLFWMMVQGKEEWKKVNKIRHTPDSSHDTESNEAKRVGLMGLRDISSFFMDQSYK